MEITFKALSDPNRRRLLDLLRDRDGQTLTELEQELEMTRFGVMKHLKLLEEAHLVLTRKVGRHKYHYLNPVPIQEIADRWISTFAKPWSRSLTALKIQLEDAPERNVSPMSQTLTKPQHVYETIIRTTPEKLWDALTNPKTTPHYYFNTTLQTTLQVGDPFQYIAPDGTLMIGGSVIEVDPPHKLVTSFRLNCSRCSEEAKEDAPSRVTYLIEPIGDLCRLTLIHDGFEGETATFGEVTKGWPGILANLKTWLETGIPLNYGPAAS